MPKELAEEYAKEAGILFMEVSVRVIEAVEDVGQNQGEHRLDLRDHCAPSAPYPCSRRSS